MFTDRWCVAPISNIAEAHRLGLAQGLRLSSAAIHTQTELYSMASSQMGRCRADSLGNRCINGGGDNWRTSVALPLRHDASALDGLQKDAARRDRQAAMVSQRLNKVLKLLGGGKRERALDLLSATGEMAIEFDFVCRAFAMIYLSAEDYLNALNWCDRALAFDSRDCKTLANKGLALRGLGRADQAVACSRPTLGLVKLQLGQGAVGVSFLAWISRD